MVARTDPSVQAMQHNAREATGARGNAAATGVQYHKVTATAAPADDDVGAGECWLWWDATNGSAELHFKGKSLNGTVVNGSITHT